MSAEDTPTSPENEIPYQDPADLLADVAIRLEHTASEMSMMARTLAVVVGQMRTHGVRLTDHDRRIGALEEWREKGAAE